MSYTCITCKVLFANPELQREHYKCDWHRYNLKRKVAELPAVTKENYEERALAFKEKVAESEHQAPSFCQLCHKYFGTKNAMTNHVKSKKHLEAETKRDQYYIKVQKNNERNKLLSSNIEKMTKDLENTSREKRDSDVQSEGTFEGVSSSAAFPSASASSFNTTESGDDSEWESCDEEYEEEEEDGERIATNMCVFCMLESETIEKNVEHMMLAHSFFIPDIEYVADLEGLIAYLGEKVGIAHMCLWCSAKGKSFNSVKSAQQHMLDKGHCKMYHESEAVIEYADFYDYSSSYPDAEVTTEQSIDEEIDVTCLEGDNWQLVLPSGAVIGHRSLSLYYRQNLNPKTEHTRKSVNRVMSHYKALGWTGTTGEAALKKAKDISFMRKMQAKNVLQLGVRHNKLQHHFRSQVPL